MVWQSATYNFQATQVSGSPFMTIYCLDHYAAMACKYTCSTSIQFLALLQFNCLWSRWTKVAFVCAQLWSRPSESQTKSGDWEVSIMWEGLWGGCCSLALQGPPWSSNMFTFVNWSWTLGPNRPRQLSGTEFHLEFLFMVIFTGIF